jgi:hypothetical protein
MPGCSRELGEVRAVAETSPFADHLARSHLLRFGGDRRSALLVPNALVQDLPDQAARPVRDGADRLRMSEAWDDSPIHDGEDRALRLHRGVGGLIQDASHLVDSLWGN